MVCQTKIILTQYGNEHVLSLVARNFFHSLLKLTEFNITNPSTFRKNCLV